MALVRKEFTFSPEDAELAEALALANFPRPGGRGNVNELVRRLIRIAAVNPRRFGLVEPGKHPEDMPTVAEEFLAATQGQKPLDLPAKESEFEAD